MQMFEYEPVELVLCCSKAVADCHCCSQTISKINVSLKEAVTKYWYYWHYTGDNNCDI